jgi:hypothetical protein
MTGALAPSAYAEAGPFSCLSFRFRLASESEAQLGRLRTLYEQCEVGRDQGALCPAIDLDRVAAGDGADAFAIGAMAYVDRATVDASRDDMLLLHASAAARGDRLVVFVGPSGAGKSTLAAALTATGWTYFGDEVIGLDLHGSLVCANPKPLKLDQRSRRALHHIGAAGVREDKADELLVAPRALGSCARPSSRNRPSAIVRVAFRSGASARLTLLTRADVVEILADQSYNFARWGSGALDGLAHLTAHVPGAELMFGDVAGAVGELTRWI